MVLTYRAYRNLKCLRIAMPITVLFHAYMVAANWGDGLPWVSLVLLAFIVLLAALAMPIYRSDADTRFNSQSFGTNFSQG